MSQSLAKNLIHLIYSTKNREPVLTENIRDELHRYSAGILKEWESPAILINSVEDHVHLLYSQSKNHSLSKIVEEVKKGSSKWIKTQGVEGLLDSAIKMRLEQEIPGIIIDDGAFDS